MNKENFDIIVDEQIDRCVSILDTKKDEYATTTDRLHNFNVASELMGVKPKQALAGMMVKHTVSVYDMCMSDEEFPITLWDEKITDHINYLLLLRAVIEDGTETTS